MSVSVEINAAPELAREQAQEHAPIASGAPEWEEKVSVVTSSFAAVATAWAAFQAATWSSKQTFLLAHAFRQRALSTEARLEGDQQVHIDADLFIAWGSAYAEDKITLAQVLYDRFPPRLKVATDAWLATKPLTTKNAAPHPFAMPQYQLEAHQRALALGREADGAIERGRDANLTADTYVFGTVFLALIILLASLSTRLRYSVPRRAMLYVSGGGLVAALVWLALRPVAWPGD